MEFIENSVTLADIAKATKSTATKVESDCRELDMFVGCDWVGRLALSTVDAHAYVSGDARREHDHAAAHHRWRADSEAWEADRDQVRRTAYDARFDTSRRRGVGDPQASAEAAQAGSAAVVSFEKATPQPTFGDVESSGVFTRKMKRAKEAVVR